MKVDNDKSISLTAHHIGFNMLEKTVLKPKQHRLFLLFSVLALVLSACVMQHSLFLHWDNAWFLGAGRKLLAGGNYTHDFFSPSPPMIIYLYLPVLILEKMGMGNLAINFNFYIFSLAILSLGLSYLCLQKIFRNEDVFQKNLSLITLAFTFLILPVFEVGQRDHLFYLFSIPYILITTCRLEKKTFPDTLAILIGFLAGLGFVIKPQFIIIFILIECCALIQTRKMSTLLRTEVIAILLTLFIYLNIVFIFNSDYIFFVIPYLWTYYYADVGQTLYKLIANENVAFSFISLLGSLLLLKYQTYKKLMLLCIVAWGGFLISYLSQRTPYYYHLLPLLSISFLLFSILYGDLITKFKITRLEMIVWGLMTIFALIITKRIQSGIWLTFIFNPELFFTFFILLFSMLFLGMPNKQDAAKRLCWLALVIYLTFIGTVLASRSGFSSHRFSITIVVLVISFCFIMSYRSKVHFLKTLGCITIGATLLAAPAQTALFLYNFNVSRSVHYFNPLSDLIAENVKKNSLAVFGELYLGFPGIPFANSVQRLDAIWMANSLISHRHWEWVGKQFPRDTQRDFFADIIVEDLQRKKPEYIFIESSKVKSAIGSLLRKALQVVHLAKKEDIPSHLIKSKLLFLVDEGSQLTAYLYSNKDLSEPIKLSLEASDLATLRTQPYNVPILATHNDIGLLERIFGSINAHGFYLQPHFDFISYFNNDPIINKEWAKYHFYKKIIIDFTRKNEWSIYKRKNTKT